MRVLGGRSRAPRVASSSLDRLPTDHDDACCCSDQAVGHRATRGAEIFGPNRAASDPSNELSFGS